MAIKRLEKKEVNYEGDQGKSVKNLLTIKSILSLELEYSKCMNSESIPRANGIRSLFIVSS